MAPTPAAWKPDPSKRFRLRWWDGQRWTEWVSDDSGATLSDEISDAEALFLGAREKLSRVRGSRKSASPTEIVEESPDLRRSRWRAGALDASPGRGAEKQSSSRRSRDRLTATTYEKCEALYPRPSVPQEKVKALVKLGSLHPLVESPPAGWSKSRQPPTPRHFRQLKYSQQDEVRTLSQLAKQLEIWDEEVAQHRLLNREAVTERVRKEKKWEEIIVELWRHALIADAVLSAIPDPPKALLGQHSRILRRFNGAQLPEGSTRDNFERSIGTRPVLESHEITSVLRDASGRLKKARASWNKTVVRLAAAEDVFASIDEKISQIRRAASERKFSPPESSGSEAERPASWQAWIRGVRKYLDSFGPDGPPPKISSDSLEPLEEHVHELLNSLCSDLESLEKELGSATFRQCRAVLPYLEQVTADPQQSLSEDLIGTVDRCREYLTELQDNASQLNSWRNLIEKSKERFSSDLAALKETGGAKNTTYLDQTDDPWEIYHLLQIHTSNRFDQHHDRIQDAAVRYESRLQAAKARKEKKEKAAEKAKLSAARKTLPNARRRATIAKKKLASMQEELAFLERTSRSRDSKIATLEKRLGRLREDLRVAQYESPVRRRRIETNIARVQEDLEEFENVRDKVKVLKIEVSFAERDLSSANAEIKSAESVIADSEAKSGSTRGAEPRIGFVKDSHDFEQFLAKWMRWAGWPEARAVPVGPDGGVDVKARGALGQAKYWDKPVGIEEIQRHMGVVYKLKPEGRIFLSKNGYTPQAVEFAEREGMVLLEMKSEAGSAKAVGVTSIAKRLVKGT